MGYKDGLGYWLLIYYLRLDWLGWVMDLGWEEVYGFLNEVLGGSWMVGLWWSLLL